MGLFPKFEELSELVKKYDLGNYDEMNGLDENDMVPDDNFDIQVVDYSTKEPVNVSDDLKDKIILANIWKSCFARHIRMNAQYPWEGFVFMENYDKAAYERICEKFLDDIKTKGSIDNSSEALNQMIEASDGRFSYTNCVGFLKNYNYTWLNKYFTKLNNLSLSGEKTEQVNSEINSFGDVLSYWCYEYEIKENDEVNKSKMEKEILSDSCKFIDEIKNKKINYKGTKMGFMDYLSIKALNEFVSHLENQVDDSLSIEEQSEKYGYSLNDLKSEAVKEKFLERIKSFHTPEFELLLKNGNIDAISETKLILYNNGVSKVEYCPYINVIKGLVPQFAKMYNKYHPEGISYLNCTPRDLNKNGQLGEAESIQALSSQYVTTMNTQPMNTEVNSGGIHK